MFGSLLFGFVADSYGRKKAIIHSTILCVFLGILAAFAVDFSTFLLARFFVAVGTAALFGIPNVLSKGKQSSLTRLQLHLLIMTNL